MDGLFDQTEDPWGWNQESVQVGHDIFGHDLTNPDPFYNPLNVFGNDIHGTPMDPLNNPLGY